MEYIVKTPDKIDLFIRSFEAVNPKAVVLVVHGMGEHGDRYIDLSSKLGDVGFRVMTMDHRGHGRSSGKRGHTPSFDHLMNDIQLVVDKTDQLFSGLPIFIFSQSMGANLALNYMIRRQDSRIIGLISSSPYLRLAFDPPKWKVVLGRLASRIYPKLAQTTGLEVEAISRIPEVIEKYKKDPLVHDQITASFFVEVHQAGPYAIKHIDKIKIPVLVMHGDADRLTSAEASRELVERSGDNVKGIFFSEGYHELHNEPNREEVFHAMNEWMSEVLKGQ